jgi:hypothetical protein
MVALVQHTQAGPTSGATSLTATLASGTTAGNCLIVVATSVTGGGKVSGVTLGGSAGNFAPAVNAVNSANPTGSVNVDIWADPNCAGGQTSAVTSFTASTFSAVDVYEVSGLATASPLDKSAGNQNGASSGTGFDSTPTAATAQAAEFWVWVCGAISATSGNDAVTGPGAPWTNEPQVSIGSLTGHRSGYQITSSAGAADAAGTLAPAGYYAAAVATFLPAAGTASATPAPLVVPQAAVMQAANW